MQTGRRESRQAARRRREAACRLLAVIAAAVLVLGILSLVTVELRIASKRRAIASAESTVRQLDASASNLSLCVDQYHNLSEIGRRAEQLGMQSPEDGQVRHVVLDRSGNAIAMNGASEENAMR